MNKLPLLENIDKDILNKVAKSYGEKKTIYEHTKEVLEVYNNFFEEYPNSFNKEEKELIYLACLYHDLGKANLLFQNKITNNKNDVIDESEIHHGFLSPLFLPEKEIENNYSLEVLKVLSTSIFYHHTREYTKKDIEYVNYAKEYIEKPFSITSGFFPREGLLLKYPGTNNYIPDNVYGLYFKIKGMINKFDYTASSGYLISELKNKNIEITNKIKNKFQESNLTDMQKYALNNSDKNLILIGSTGSGKTESSLLWLNKDKGFYTLPLKVASNAIYKRIKESYASPEKDSIALLHSDSFEILKENDIKYEEYKQMKLLNSPLTICTVDQIFKFPFKALGQEIYAATLSYSKVIIDEIQMYSPLILACILTGLKIIVNNGGKFLITTATFPKFLENKLAEVIGEENYEIKSFIKEDEIKRHWIKIINNDFDYEKIVNSSKDKKILVICNIVSKSIEVYRKLKELKAEKVYLLHARFIKKDREELEKNIKSFAESDEVGIWVTTQLVEASLDIDFDELHTEIAPADSLIQRFGRCYRKREYKKEESNIFIYHNNSKNFIYDEKLLELSLEKLQKYDNKLLTEIEKIKYLNSVYDEEVLKKRTVKYIELLEEKLANFKDIIPFSYDNKEIQNLFRDINTINVIPDSVYLENEEEISNLIDKIVDKKISAKDRYEARRTLLKFTVPVYKINDNENEIKAKGEKIGIFKVPGNYSKETGFERANEDEDRFI